MAKNKPAEPEIRIREGAPDFFVNSLGKTVGVYPIAHDYITSVIQAIEKKYRDRGEPLDPPRYSFSAEGGIVMEAVHDEVTINDDRTTPEEKEAWGRYIDAISRLAVEQNDTTLRALCLKAVRVNLTGDEYQQWVAEQEFLGLPVPENEMERRYQYIRSTLIITAHDLPDSDKMILMETAVLLGFTGASKEQIAQMREMFRRQMGGAGRGTDTTQGTGTETEE